VRPCFFLAFITTAFFFGLWWKFEEISLPISSVFDWVFPVFGCASFSSNFWGKAGWACCGALLLAGWDAGAVILWDLMCFKCCWWLVNEWDGGASIAFSALACRIRKWLQMKTTVAQIIVRAIYVLWSIFMPVTQPLAIDGSVRRVYTYFISMFKLQFWLFFEI